MPPKTTHNTREGIDERQIRSDWQEFWYKESKNTEQSYLTPDTHGIVIDYLKELYKSHHQELQKARQDWLREEIVKLEGMKRDCCAGIGPCDEICRATNEGNHIIQTIIDRYQSELDQPTV